MLVKPDFSEIKDSVEPGTYSVTIKGADLGEWSGQKGTTTYVNWKLETFNEANPKNNGRIIFHKTPISGGGAFRLQQIYKAATGKILSSDHPQFDTEQLLGATLEVEVIDGMKNGTPTGYTEVKSVRSISAASN